MAPWMDGVAAPPPKCNPCNFLCPHPLYLALVFSCCAYIQCAYMRACKESTTEPPLMTTLVNVTCTQPRNILWQIKCFKMVLMITIIIIIIIITLANVTCTQPRNILRPNKMFQNGFKPQFKRVTSH